MSDKGQITGSEGFRTGAGAWEAVWKQRYDAGYKAGYADKLMGIRSEYAWFVFETEGQSKREYSRGYRDGWNEAKEWK